MSRPLSGYEKGKMWTKAIKTALKDYKDDKVKAGDALHHIALDMVKDALNGDPQSKNFVRREIGDRLEGKAVQAVQHEETQYIVQVGAQPPKEEEEELTH